MTFTGVWSTLPLTGLGYPSGVSGDSSGNLYVTDTTLTSVIKLTPGGTQSTVGSGLSSPQGVCIDSAGNVYVTSSTDNKVYKITSGGTQTAIGSGWSTPWSIAVDASGTVWVTDGNGLSSLTTGGTQTLVQSSSSLRGVSIDGSGNVYYGDNTNHEVYEMAGGTGSPSAHNYAAHTQGLWVDANGLAYTAQTSANVYRSDDAYGDFTLFGDTQVSESVWGDGHQNLYIADGYGIVEKLAMGPVDFGSVNVCPTGATVTPCSSTQTLNFALDSEVSSSQVMSALTQGASALDYAFDPDDCTGNTNVGGTCAVTVVFTPQAAGLRTGETEAVGSSVYNYVAAPVGPHPRVGPAVHSQGEHSQGVHPNSVHPYDEPAGTLLAAVPLHGIGLAPLGAFSTAPIQTGYFTTGSDAYPYGVTISASNNYYVTDAHNCVVQETPGGGTGITFTVAGTVCGPAAGDGGPATSAVLTNPLRTALDGAGNLYIADAGSHTVREVNALTGTISTVAGTGTSGYSGDGGPATSANFDNVRAIVLDAVGNGYIADFSQQVVRRVDALTGIVTTVAGTGTAGYIGDMGPATSAELHGPDALTLDTAGNLYIADDLNNVIRKLVLSTGVITTVAGTGTAGYSGDGGAATSAQISDPEGITVDVAGNLYIADANNYVVRKVDVTSGIITTAVGVHSSTQTYTGDGGPAVLAGLSYLEDVAFTPFGFLVISDSDNGILRGVLESSGIANFSSTALGSTSTAQDTTLSNEGNASLALSGLAFPTDFSLGGADTTCTSSTTLALGANCILGIEFVPTADGLLDEELNVAGNFGNIPGAQQGIEVIGTGTGSAPAKLAFSGSIASIAVGGNLGTVVVDVEDSNGNLVGAASSLVTLTITGPGGYSQTVTVTAVNGMASFNLGSLPLSTAGSYTLTATSPSLTQAQTSATVTAGGGNPSTPAELAIPNTVPTSIVAGESLGVVPVDIENSSATLLTGTTNTVTLTITGPGGYSHSVTVAAVAGVANFDFSSLALTTPGTYTLTATSSGLASATATVTVSAGSPSTPVELAIASSVPATVGSGGNLGVVAVDVNNSAGAVIAGATNSVTLTLTGPGGFSYSVTVTAVNGVASFDLSAVTLTAPGTYTLTAASGRLTSAIATFAVTVDFTIVVTTGTPSSSLIPPGAATTFNFTLAPVTGSFASPITVTATGMPAGASYSFSPATVTPGASPVGTAMSLQTLRNGSAALRTGAGTFALALLLLPLTAWRRARRAWRGAGLLSLILPLLMLGAVAGLSGCGAGGLFGQPQQSYTITVTGTSGQISHSATVTLTVE